MADVAKWALLTVFLVALIATVIPLVPGLIEANSAIANLSSSLNAALGSVSSILLTARKLLNNFLPASLVSIVLSMSIGRRLVFFVIDTATAAMSIFK